MALSKITNASVADTAVHGRRNLIINGAMNVAQRGTSFTGNVYTLDRFKPSAANTDQLVATVTQESDSPNGFSNSLKLTTTTAETTLDADEHLSVRYRIEGQDLQHLKFGTSDALQTTLSFWVKSSEAATFTVFIYQADDGRMVTKPYTINSADTWEYKTITFPADTTGVIDNNNGEGFQISFGLGAGSNLTGGSTGSWAAYSTSNEQAGNTSTIPTTLNATWQITGVQLEVGDTATPFEHRSYGEELALCQRYYYVLGDGSIQSNSKLGNGYGWASGQVELIVNFPVQLRSAPTLKQPSGSNKYTWASSSGSITFDDLTIYQPNVQNCLIYKSGLSGVTQGRGYRAHLNNDSDGYVAFDAEL